MTDIIKKTIIILSALAFPQDGGGGAVGVGRVGVTSLFSKITLVPAAPVPAPLPL
jgi:hypothetical protein